MWHIIFQEKQGNDQRIEYSSDWFKGPSFSYKVLKVLHYSMHGLLMETTFVLLAQ